MECVSGFKFLGSVVNESGRRMLADVESGRRMLADVESGRRMLVDVESGRRIVASGRKAAGVTRYLGNTRGLRVACVKVLHESLFLPVVLYGSESMIWWEKERPRIPSG